MGLQSGTLILLPYCYFGKVTSESFAQMCDSIYYLNWPHLPIELQKLIILMIAHMQQSIFYHGFGIVQLDLNTFVRVSKRELYSKVEFNLISAQFQLLRTVVSYYFMFKTVAQQ